MMNPKLLLQIIKQRVTEKVLANVDSATVVPTEIAEKNDSIVRDAIKAAGMAPFHYPRSKEIPEPWRAYHLWNIDSNNLANYLEKELKVESKEPKLLAACSSCVFITWHPEYPGILEEKKRVIEEEHIAATGAMVQNLLLTLTAHGFGNYWSSGGILRSPELFEKLKIPKEERLMGVIFIEYPEVANLSHERKPGALRKIRSLKWISDLSVK